MVFFSLNNVLLKILTSFFAIGLKTFAAIQNDDEDIIDDEWNKLLERHGLDVEKRRRCDEVFIGTTNTTSNAEKKKKKKKEKRDDRLAPAEAKAASRKATTTEKRTREEFVLAVRTHEKFREYVEIMMTCRKLTAQTKRERESLEKKDKEFLAKLGGEKIPFERCFSVADVVVERDDVYHG